MQSCSNAVGVSYYVNSVYYVNYVSYYVNYCYVNSAAGRQDALTTWLIRLHLICCCDIHCHFFLGWFRSISNSNCACFTGTGKNAGEAKKGTELFGWLQAQVRSFSERHIFDCIFNVFEWHSSDHCHLEVCATYLFLTFKLVPENIRDRHINLI